MIQKLISWFGDWYKFLYISLVSGCKKKLKSEAIPLDPRETVFDDEDMKTLNRLLLEKRRKKYFK